MDRARSQDRDRRGGMDRRASVDQAREAARVKQTEGALRAVERDHPEWCHVFAEHVRATDQQLARRAATGVNARGQQERFRADNATKWQSADAMATVVYRMESAPYYQQAKAAAERHHLDRFAVRRPLQEVLGAGWRADVYGCTRASGGRQASQWNAASDATAVWQRRSDGKWHLLTCYPEPGALRSRACHGCPPWSPAHRRSPSSPEENAW